MAERLQPVEPVRVVVAVAVVDVGCDPTASLAERTLEQDAATGERPLTSVVNRLVLGAVAAVAFAFVMRQRWPVAASSVHPASSRASALVPRDGDRFARLRGRPGRIGRAGGERLARVLLIGDFDCQSASGALLVRSCLQVARERPAKLGGNGAITLGGASAKLVGHRNRNPRRDGDPLFRLRSCCHQGSSLRLLVVPWWRPARDGTCPYEFKGGGGGRSSAARDAAAAMSSKLCRIAKTASGSPSAAFLRASESARMRVTRSTSGACEGQFLITLALALDFVADGHDANRTSDWCQFGAQLGATARG